MKSRAEPLPLIIRSQNGCENASSSQLGRNLLKQRVQLDAAQRGGNGVGAIHEPRSLERGEQAPEAPLVHPQLGGDVLLRLHRRDPLGDLLVERQLRLPEIDLAIAQSNRDPLTLGGRLIHPPNPEFLAQCTHARSLTFRAKSRQ